RLPHRNVSRKMHPERWHLLVYDRLPDQTPHLVDHVIIQVCPPREVLVELPVPIRVLVMRLVEPVEPEPGTQRSQVHEVVQALKLLTDQQRLGPEEVTQVQD